MNFLLLVGKFKMFLPFHLKMPPKCAGRLVERQRQVFWVQHTQQVSQCTTERWFCNGTRPAPPAVTTLSNHQNIMTVSLRACSVYPMAVHFDYLVNLYYHSPTIQPPSITTWISVKVCQTHTHKSLLVHVVAAKGFALTKIRNCYCNGCKVVAVVFGIRLTMFAAAQATVHSCSIFAGWNHELVNYKKQRLIYI